MAWTAELSEDMSPNVVYEVLKKHRLLPESVVASASVCNAVGTSGVRFTVKDETGEHVADVFVSDVEEGETAAIDLIPVAKHFRTGYHEDFKAAMSPILHDLFEGFGVRRVSSALPESRSRTKRALCVLGFKVEGRIRDAVKLHGKPPEDLRVLGLLRSEYDKEKDDGS
jgi:hypothetical protein